MIICKILLQLQGHIDFLLIYKHIYDSLYAIFCEPINIWSDFFMQIKNIYVQSSIIWIIYLAPGIIITISVHYYYCSYKTKIKTHREGNGRKEHPYYSFVM